MIAAIIAAAGSGERFGASIPKALIQLGDRTLLEHAVASISAVADQIVVTAPAGYEEQIKKLVGDDIVVVTGGATRSESVRAGLAVIKGADFVLVHDAARPFASPAVYQHVISAIVDGAAGAVPGIPVVDTIKQVNASNVVTSTLHRETLRAIQTPQAFRAEALRKAHANGGEGTDDATLIEKIAGEVVVVEGEVVNRKITTREDLEWAVAHANHHLRGEV